MGVASARGVEHPRLYEAIPAHDPEAAAAIMGTHLDSAIQAIERAARTLLQN